MACGRWIEWEVLGSLVLTTVPNVESRSSVASQLRVQSLGAMYLHPQNLLCDLGLVMNLLHQLTHL